MSAKGARLARDAFKRLRLWEAAESLFHLYPNLAAITARYALFVTPFATTSEGARMLDLALQQAMSAAHERRGDDRRVMAGYIKALIGTSKELARVRLSVPDSDGHWLIWRYNEPLADMLSGRDPVVQTRPRSRPEAVGPIAVKLMAAICTTADIEIARIAETL